MEEKKFPLPNKAKKLMEEIHDMVGEDEFILYGGTPIDILLNENTKVHDLDIAIKGINKHKIKKFREKIKKEEFEIIEPCREYYIYKNKKVILVYAKNKKWFLDVVFLNDPQLIGQFNIETLYFRYPQLDYTDKFNALDGIKKKKIKLIRGMKKENPHLLLGRFLRLCSKYNISLKDNIKILSELKNQLKKWKISSNFHKDAYLSCISSLFKSIVQSRNKMFFMEILIDISILKILFPEMKHMIKFYKEELILDISKTKTKLDVVVLFYKYLKASDRQLFRNKIKALKIRKWDDQDLECSKYFHLR